MPIEGFNSEEFAKNLAQQAVDVVPKDLNEDYQKYIVNTLYNFCVLAGNALIQDTELNINANQAVIITQLIGEWTFHKSIDLIRSGIPHDYWDVVLQKIAYSVFEIAKHTQISNIEQEQAIRMVEQEVNAAYTNAINDLAQEGKIHQEQVQEILSYSNIDSMAQENTTSQEQSPQDQQKILKYASIAILLRTLPENQVKNILSKLTQDEASQILTLMKVKDLEKQLDPGTISNFLDEFKKALPKPVPKLNKEINAINSLTEEHSEEAVQKIIKFERLKIREYVSYCIKPSAQKAKFANFSPYISNIIYNYLKYKLSA